MTISDLLTLIGILLAIIAFISEKNREYIFLKLSRFELFFIVILTIYIHFLLSYSWWRNKIGALSVFEIEGYPSPEAWAYIVSIILLGFSIWSIFFGQFPSSRRTSLISYYKKLLLRNEISFLAQLVEKYHLNQIINYLQKKKNITIEEPTGLWQIDHQKYLKTYNKLMKGRMFSYGASVYNSIILNETFLDNLVNNNPYLFATLIKELNHEKLKDDDFVNRYLKILTQTKNGNFFREVRATENLGQYDAYVIDEENPILFALFNDIKVCSINQAWRGIGEQAILEMHEEAKKEFSPLRESDREQDSDTLWSYRITIAIWYFDIMVRQAIVQGVNDHMWLFYYTHFTDTIISNMKELPFVDSEQNRRSRNYNLIETMFTKMMDWKDVAVKSKQKKLIKSIYDCLGQCIYKLAITNKLREEDKQYLINWVWEDLIKLYGDDDEQNAIVTEIIDFGFEMFKKPTILFSSDLSYRAEESQKYLNSLSELWENRDTPILTGVVGTRADDFKTKVIDVLL